MLLCHFSSLFKHRTMNYVSLERIVPRNQNNLSSSLIIKRTFISLDPLVNWFAEGQKRKFDKTVLTKNIKTTFLKKLEHKDLGPSDTAQVDEVSAYLKHQAIEDLKKEFIIWASESTGSGSNWVCYFGPPRCGMSLGLLQAGKEVSGVAYVSLRQQGTDEGFNIFIAKQMQTTEMTKIETMEPGNLREAFKNAVKELASEDIKPILIVDDCEFGIEEGGATINNDFRRFLDILLELSGQLSVYLTSSDVRLIKNLKQISELREHLEFRSWSYAGLQDVLQFLEKSNLKLSPDQKKETALTLMGHDGDITDYITGVGSRGNHKVELYKIVTRGYLQLREALAHPPVKYQDLKDRSKFRIIAYCTFWAIHSQFHKALENLTESSSSFEFPINKEVVVPLTCILNQSVRKIDPSITMDEMFSGIEILMSDVYGILQEVNLPFEQNNEFEGDIWLTWSAAKYQSAFNRLSQDRIIIEYMKETGINIPLLIEESVQVKNEKKDNKP